MNRRCVSKIFSYWYGVSFASRACEHNESFLNFGAAARTHAGQNVSSIVFLHLSVRR